MGSAESEVSAGTKDLVLECAYFQPTRIRRTRRALELSSESSYRFERGIDMLGMPDVLAAEDRADHGRGGRQVRARRSTCGPSPAGAGRYSSARSASATSSAWPWSARR